MHQDQSHQHQELPAEQESSRMQHKNGAELTPSSDKPQMQEHEQLLATDTEDQGVRNGAATHICCDLKSVKSWGLDAFPIILLFATVQACTWLVLRSVISYAAAHTVPGHAMCQPDCGLACAQANEQECQRLSVCRWVQRGAAAASRSHDEPVCAEEKGEIWVQYSVALSQWSYTAGIGLTVACPWLDIVVLTVGWMGAFSIVLAMAILADGSFEFKAAGPLLVGAACTVRLLDGFLEVIIFRYIAARFPEHKADVTVFMGTIEKIVGMIFVAVIAVMVEAGWFPA